MTVLLILNHASASAQERVRKEGVRVTKERPVAAAWQRRAPRLLGVPLLQAFDTAQEIDLRRAILTQVPTFPDAEVRRELLLRGLKHAGDMSGSFIAGVAALTAMQMGDEGKLILREAISRQLIRDERTRLTVEATLRHPE